jgi:multidrug efflux system outer membrane protein
MKTYILYQKIEIMSNKSINSLATIEQVGRALQVAMVVLFFSLFTTGCKTSSLVERSAIAGMPDAYLVASDTNSSAQLSWQEYFQDRYLVALIDTALANNQELNIILQEIRIANNEVQAKRGELLPSVSLKGGAGVDKTARYTPLGANEATTDIEPGREMPDPVPDFMLGAVANWEVDIWHKLRNAKKAATMRYLGSIEGQHFMQTNLIAEIAHSYYELLALDKQLVIVQRNIEIQSSALRIVRIQKTAARVTELAVRKFEAEVLHTRSLQFDIQQHIVVKENELNFLLGRFPQPIARESTAFDQLIEQPYRSGVPAQLLGNRPDIRQAELALSAAKLEVKVAKARFYPSLDISAALGLQAFNPSFLVKAPESVLYGLAGDVTAPLLNRKAIKAAYKSANARQLQTVFAYEQTILKAYMEVLNQLNNIENLSASYALRAQEVEALTQSIKIANDLFKSARADYMEVLLTQRDALESKFDLVETQMQQANARIALYKALGGGWQRR